MGQNSTGVDNLGFYKYLSERIEKEGVRGPLFDFSRGSVNGAAHFLTRAFSEYIKYPQKKKGENLDDVLQRSVIRDLEKGHTLESFRPTFVQEMQDSEANPYVTQDIVGHGSERVEAFIEKVHHKHYAGNSKNSVRALEMMKRDVSVLKGLIK